MSKKQNFTVTLTPHRSLSGHGFVAVMSAVVAANLVAGMMFYVLGAWPVLGFMGLDIALIWWAFRASYSDGAKAEKISVSGDRVLLERVGKDGSVDRQDFNRRWVRVELEHDAAREIVGRLLLWSHGRPHEIASFLGAEERQSLAKALRRAL